MKSKNKDQLSIFDITIVKSTHRYKKSSKAIFKNCSKVTLDELNIKSIYKMFLERYIVDRTIRYPEGSLGIDVKEKDSIKTHYINRHGKEEFIFNRRIPVLPMDKIIYYTIDYKINSIQFQKLQEIIKRTQTNEIIKRKGDFNIFIKRTDDLLSIIPNGWILPFKNISIDYNADEVVPLSEIFRLKE